MSDFQIDDQQVAEFIRSLDELQQAFPRQARSVMRRVGTKVRTKVRSVARSSIIEETGDYVRSISVGKVWVQDGSGYNIRVYPKQKMAWYAFLLEYGWIHTGHKPDKHQGRFMPGFHIYERASQQFQPEFFATMEAEFIRMVNKIP